MLENRNQFSNMLKKQNKTKQNKTEDAYLYDQATLFLRVILEESIDRFGMNIICLQGVTSAKMFPEALF